MPFDQRTVVLCSILTSGYLSGLLLFYRRFLKTYPGFRYWTYGTLLLCLGHIGMSLRPYLPLPFGLFVVNTLFITVANLRLQGTSLFVRGKPISRLWYANFLVFWAACIPFYFVNDLIGPRALILDAVMIASMCRMAWLWFEGYRKQRHASLLALTLCWTVMPLVSFFHALYWFFHPDTPLWAPVFVQFLTFSAILIIDLCSVTSFLLANHQRTEKTFDLAIGLLPVCAYCSSVREKDNIWVSLERYLSKRAKTQITHGICPQCRDRLLAEEGL